MRVLVTGGAGFIGSHLVDALREGGHEVVVLDDLSSGRRENVPAEVRLVEADIGNREAVEALFHEFRPEAVLHQAAQVSVSVSVREPVRDARTNVLGSLELLEASARHGVGRFVFASTGGAIYGHIPDGERAAVTREPHPMSPYACAKYAVERYLEMYEAERGLAVTSLRYANVYGPRQDPHGEAGVVAIFATRLLRGEPLLINARADIGDEGCVRDYVYVGDVVRANLSALRGEVREFARNVGTGVGTTTRALALSLAGAVGVTAEIRDAPKRPGDVGRSVLEPPAQQTFVPLDEGLAQTAAWFRAR